MITNDQLTKISRAFGGKPIVLVPVEHTDWCERLKCFWNVAMAANAKGGNLQTSWVLSHFDECPSVFVASHHAIWNIKGTELELDFDSPFIDISPHNDYLEVFDHRYCVIDDEAIIDLGLPVLPDKILVTTKNREARKFAYNVLREDYRYCKEKNRNPPDLIMAV